LHKEKEKRKKYIKKEKRKRNRHIDGRSSPELHLRIMPLITTIAGAVL
jgi:hypothetical protein